MKKEIKKRLIFYPFLFTVIGISTYWWPGPVQWRNMRQARREIDSVKKELEGDARFSPIMIGVGTVNLGRDIYVRGDIPDQQSLEYLKSLIEKKISPKYRVRYIVKIQENSNTSEPSSEEKTEEVKPILSEKEKRISKNISDYFQLGFSVEIKGPLTIEEVEKESLDELSISSRKDIPKVPFGFNNNRWNNFKSKYKDGDEIYYFSSDENSWDGLYGREGYALIRNEKVVLVIITILS
ncbi:MAG: hypothetical protein RQ760_18350 [Sedimentisphaerales bacterium]|nr:hypothetical protein [Sedimentisphaerales bacterium]